MLKKTITYTDYNGVERKEDSYFNLTVTECREMDLSSEGGMVERINKIIDAKDVPALYNLFKGIILAAYGEKSADGKSFVKKNGELAQAFTETPAYDILMNELCTDAKAASEFVNGVIPKAEPAQTEVHPAIK